MCFQPSDSFVLFVLLFKFRNLVNKHYVFRLMFWFHGRSLHAKRSYHVWSFWGAHSNPIIHHVRDHCQKTPCTEMSSVFGRKAWINVLENMIGGYLLPFGQMVSLRGTVWITFLSWVVWDNFVWGKLCLVHWPPHSLGLSLTEHLWKALKDLLNWCDAMTC